MREGPLPRQRRGTTPQMRGRYPDFDVLDETGHWDEATRRVVLARLEQPGPLRFFSESEADTLDAFCDVVTGQDADPRIPVLHMVDRKLADAELDGFRFAWMPDDRETWRLVARGLDEQARSRFGAATYAALDADGRHEICRLLAGGELSDGVWDDLDAATAWSVVTRAILAAFYSHPWAWNEIGFAGPAYPRGYAALGANGHEHWEGREARSGDA